MFFLQWHVPWLLFEFFVLMKSIIHYQQVGFSQSAEESVTGRDAWAALDPYDPFRVVFMQHTSCSQLCLTSGSDFQPHLQMFHVNTWQILWETLGSGLVPCAFLSTVCLWKMNLFDRCARYGSVVSGEAWLIFFNWKKSLNHRMIEVEDDFAQPPKLTSVKTKSEECLISELICYVFPPHVLASLSKNPFVVSCYTFLANLPFEAWERGLLIFPFKTFL